MTPLADLTRRERQIMDVVFQLGRATAADVHRRLRAAPSLTAVRTLIRILEEKGHLRHEVDGRTHVYSAAVPAHAAQRTALRHLLRTFFGGSTRGALVALLDLDGRELSPAERRHVAELIRGMKERGE
jgi:BlaI family penicillinase repressor